MAAAAAAGCVRPSAGMASSGARPSARRRVAVAWPTLACSLRAGEQVKVPCPVVKKTKVPFTNYKEQWCDVEVDVPKEVVTEKTGYRVDTHQKGKLVEIKQKELFEMSKC